MTSESWRLVLVVALAFNAVLGFAYRVYRLTKGGPMGDVVGQSVLGALLGLLALGIAADTAWLLWVALGYGLLFGLAVMPVWTLAVLIPLPPERIDYAFTGVYWAAVLLIVVAAIAA